MNRLTRLKTLACAVTLVAALSSSGQSIGERIWNPPPAATYFSMANTNWPPLPFDPFDPDEISVYWLGSIDGFGAYPFYDRGTNYDAVATAKANRTSGRYNRESEDNGDSGSD